MNRGFVPCKNEGGFSFFEPGTRKGTFRAIICGENVLPGSHYNYIGVVGMSRTIKIVCAGILLALGLSITTIATEFELADYKIEFHVNETLTLGNVSEQAFPGGAALFTQEIGPVLYNNTEIIGPKATFSIIRYKTALNTFYPRVAVGAALTMNGQRNVTRTRIDDAVIAGLEGATGSCRIIDLNGMPFSTAYLKISSNEVGIFQVYDGAEYFEQVLKSLHIE